MNFTWNKVSTENETETGQIEVHHFILFYFQTFQTKTAVLDERSNYHQ